MAENNPNPSPTPTRTLEDLEYDDDRKEGMSLMAKMIWTIILILVVGLVACGLTSCVSGVATKETPVAKTGGLTEIRDQIQGQAEFNAGIFSNLVEALTGLSNLVSSNQVVTERRIEATRTETLIMVTNLVEASIVKTMEPFQRLLTNSPTVVTQFVATPPPVAAVTPPPPSKAPPTKTVVQPIPVIRQGGMFTRNQLVVSGPPSTDQSGTNSTDSPYWLKSLW